MRDMDHGRWSRSSQKSEPNSKKGGSTDMYIVYFNGVAYVGKTYEEAMSKARADR